MSARRSVEYIETTAALLLLKEHWFDRMALTYNEGVARLAWQLTSSDTETFKRFKARLFKKAKELKKATK